MHSTTDAGIQQQIVEFKNSRYTPKLPIFLGALFVFNPSFFVYFDFYGHFTPGHNFNDKYLIERWIIQRQICPKTWDDYGYYKLSALSIQRQILSRIFWYNRSFYEQVWIIVFFDKFWIHLHILHKMHKKRKVKFIHGFFF